VEQIKISLKKRFDHNKENDNRQKRRIAMMGLAVIVEGFAGMSAG